MSKPEAGLLCEIVPDFPGPREVTLHTLTGRGGLSISVLNYGGIVQKILAPDRIAVLEDVVLGFDHPSQYAGPHPYFGAIAGRIAGRVTRGQLLLEGRTFPLPINDPPHHLHGGIDSLDRRVWHASEVIRPDGAPSLELSISSPDGDNDYPGTVDLKVTYTVTDDNRFVFETEARSDRTTPVSLTHHSYFNLSGKSGRLTDDHRIQILAEAAFSADEWMGLTGDCPSVANQPNDARTAQRIGDFRQGLWKEHGDLYWLEEGKKLRTAARLFDPESGRLLEVATDCDCLQFYSGVGLDGSLTGKNNLPYQSGSGVCLECEGYPNAFDPSGRFGSILVQPDRPQKTRTEYRFLTSSIS